MAMPRAYALWLCFTLLLMQANSLPRSSSSGGEGGDVGKQVLGKHHGSKLITSLSSPKKAVDLSKGGFPVIFTAYNPEKQPIKVLNRMTPFEGLLDNIFTIKDPAGHIMPYRGSVAQRWPIETLSLGDYVDFLPGESKEVVLDLSEVYGFTRDGNFTVELKQPVPKTVMYYAKDLQSRQLVMPVSHTAEHKAQWRAKLQRRQHRLSEQRVVNWKQRRVGLKSEFSDEPSCTDSQQQMLHQLHDGVATWIAGAMRKDWAQEGMDGVWVLKTLLRLGQRWNETNFMCCSDSSFDPNQQLENPLAAKYLLSPTGPETIMRFPDGTTLTKPVDNGLLKLDYNDGRNWEAQPNSCLDRVTGKPNGASIFMRGAQFRMVYVCPGVFDRLQVTQESLIHQMNHFMSSHAPHVQRPSQSSHRIEITPKQSAHHTDEMVNVGLHEGIVEQKGIPKRDDGATNTYLHYKTESMCLYTSQQDLTPQKRMLQRVVQSQLLRASRV
jgi:hypothetical protein